MFKINNNIKEINTSNEKGLKIQLFRNFRSRKEVLDFTNEIFVNIMSEELGDIDYTKVSTILLDEFRNGKIGNITLELPNKSDQID